MALFHLHGSDIAENAMTNDATKTYSLMSILSAKEHGSRYYSTGEIQAEPINIPGPEREKKMYLTKSFHFLLSVEIVVGQN